MKRMGGWWRLWILLISLWGIALGLAVALDWPSHGEKHQLTEEELKMLSPQTQALVFSPRFIDDDLPSAQSARVPQPWESAPIQLEMPSGQDLLLVPCATKTQLDEVKRDYSRVQRSILMKARLSHLATFFLIWAIPSFSILAFALCVRWVARGFKGQPA